MSEGFSFSEAIQFAIRSELGRVHTCMPGIVESYDPTGPTVDVLPALQEQLPDGSFESQPIVVSVPVMFMRTARFHCSFPIEPGDTVLLLFSEAALEEFQHSGKEAAPSSLRKFALTDAIAIPGLFGLGKGSQVSDGKKLEIAFDKALLVSDGTGWEFTGDMKVNGKVTASGDVKAGSISLEQHKHGPGTLGLFLFRPVFQGPPFRWFLVRHPFLLKQGFRSKNDTPNKRYFAYIYSSGGHKMAFDLALDKLNHDLYLVNYDLALVSDLAQVTQKLNCRLQFFAGEWFLDTTQGIDLYGNVFVKNPDLSTIQALFKSAILDVPDVNSIVSYDQSYDPRARSLSVTFTVDTVYGQTTQTVTF